MKYGLFSDVHSNLEAFEAVLNELAELNVDHYVFGGDIVGYGADPEKCIKILRDLIEEGKCAYVGGNHDYAVCGLTEVEKFNMYARAAVEWTKTRIDSSDTQFLMQCALVQRVMFEKDRGFTIVHASLDMPHKWNYIFDIDDAYPNFQILEDQVCFIGHSHRPIIFSANSVVDWFIKDRFVLSEDTKYIVNIGSVGQPRDGDPRACYAVYDTDSGLIEIKRCEYDVAKAQEKILAAGLPHVLAERLSTGR